jgi:hypothetical protein
MYLNLMIIRLDKFKNYIIYFNLFYFIQFFHINYHLNYLIFCNLMNSFKNSTVIFIII